MCSRFQTNWQVIMMWNGLLWMPSCAGAHRKSTICMVFPKCFAIFVFRHSFLMGRFRFIICFNESKVFTLLLYWHIFLSLLFYRKYVNYTNAVWSLCKRQRCFLSFITWEISAMYAFNPPSIPSFIFQTLLCGLQSKVAPLFLIPLEHSLADVCLILVCTVVIYFCCMQFNSGTDLVNNWLLVKR